MISESVSFAPTCSGTPEKQGVPAGERTILDARSAAPAVVRVLKDKAFTATDSPCVAICSTLFDEICRGCGRTAMEVSNWVFMSDEEKKQVWTRILAQGYPRR